MSQKQGTIHPLLLPPSTEPEQCELHAPLLPRKDCFRLLLLFFVFFLGKLSDNFNDKKEVNLNGKQIVDAVPMKKAQNDEHKENVRHKEFLFFAICFLFFLTFLQFFYFGILSVFVLFLALQ